MTKVIGGDKQSVSAVQQSCSADKTGFQNYLSFTFYISVFHTFFLFFFLAQQPPSGPGPPHSRKFLDHTQERTTVGRTFLDEESARRRDLHVTTHKNHNRQTTMPPVGFEPTISAGERSQIYALDRAATGTGSVLHHLYKQRQLSIFL